MELKFDSMAFILIVRDVEATERFYTEHLGIRFDRNVEEDGTIWLLARIGSEVELLAFPGDPQPGNTPGIVFGLADGGIDTVVASLAAAGVEIVTPVTEAPGGWSASFRDPDGHEISLFQSEALPRVLTTTA
ncbi:MAG TPA: VOC family protein [Longimicrobiales bacterium]|nr:VOC family protein [Longimicrobiales bacterium]